MKSTGESSSIGAGISSMTGFGRSELISAGRQISVEIRSVNNRFCEIGMKLPRELNALELEIRDRLRTRIQRGKISLLISLKKDAAEEAPLQLDLQAARACFTQLQELNRNLDNEGAVTLGQLLHFSDYFTQAIEAAIDEEMKGQIFAALDAALNDLVKMRRSEGVSLAQDLLQRQTQIEQCLAQIESLAQDQPQAQMQKLRERLELLAAPGTLDPGRLETEFSLMADRLDVSEECVRLQSHGQVLRAAIAGQEPPGKKIGFLLQEIQREANTISSKSALAEISHLAVQVKEEVERMREQAQNLE